MFNNIVTRLQLQSALATVLTSPIQYNSVNLGKCQSYKWQILSQISDFINASLPKMPTLM